MKKELPWIFAVILAVSGLTLVMTDKPLKPDSTVSLSINDTYYVFDILYFLGFTALLLIFLVYLLRTLFYGFKDKTVNGIFLIAGIVMFISISLILYQLK